jgi:hypothetical protein
MALADYYGRAALAAAQILEGFEEERFLAQLSSTPVGVAFDEKVEGPQGEALLDLTVRLLARLYPSLAIIGEGEALGRSRDLARSINPAIELTDEAEIGIAVGARRDPFARTIYAGAAGWDALLDDRRPQPLGRAHNPLGAGAAACLAVAGVFRAVFGLGELDRELRFSTFTGDRAEGSSAAPRGPWRLPGEAVLVGVGAIGNAAAWAIGRSPLEGRLHLVDPECVDLGNLQRYVLCAREDVGVAKVELPRAGGSLELVRHAQRLEDFFACEGWIWDSFLLALDNAPDRRAAQAALPAWIANGWTQPGDLGCSVHPDFCDEGACVACLYLPEGPVPNEDQLVSEALGIPALQMQVRTLLHTGAPLDRGLLGAVAEARGLPLARLLPFEGRSIRELYVEGFCGGAVVAIDAAAPGPREMHVPLAHQSALAGILLAAALARRSLGADPPSTRSTQIDLLAPVGQSLARPLLARGDGRCICEDADFLAAYELKYS